MNECLFAYRNTRVSVFHVGNRKVISFVLYLKEIARFCADEGGGGEWLYRDADSLAGTW